jgi:hypothetical protein
VSYEEAYFLQRGVHSNKMQSLDIVLPLCLFERHFLEAVQRTYTSVLDNALSELQSHAGEFAT